MCDQTLNLPAKKKKGEKKKPRVMTHTRTHTLLPDVTQYAHIPALPHLPQQLLVCVRVCVFVCVCVVSLTPGEQNKAT